MQFPVWALLYVLEGRFFFNAQLRYELWLREAGDLGLNVVDGFGWAPRTPEHVLLSKKPHYSLQNDTSNVSKLGIS